jgi:hypothetical protein
VDEWYAHVREFDLSPLVREVWAWCQEKTRMKALKSIDQSTDGHYFLLSTQVALVSMCWLYFGSILAIEFSMCAKITNKDP